MPNYEFRCDRGCTSMAVRPIGTEVTPCPTCGARSTRTHRPMPFDVVGPTVDTRGMARRFTEAAAEREHTIQRFERDTDSVIQRPNDWAAPLARARAKLAHGEIDVQAVRRQTMADGIGGGAIRKLVGA